MLGPKLGPFGSYFQSKTARKLRQINESLGGYEPEGREFESLRARHSLSMYFVYLLRSQKSGPLYTGYTADLTQRLGQHNLGITKSTRHEAPWQLVYSEEFDTRSEAVRRERFFKSGRGRQEVRELLLAKKDTTGLAG